jgi:serine/threonine-protein kinase RsbW
MSGIRAGDTVRVSVPADTAYVGLLRTVAAGLAGRLDLDLDHVEDLRLAVSEACSLVLPDATGTGELTIELRVTSDGLVTEVSAPTRRTSPPSVDSFAWTVISALADDAAVDVTGGVLSIRLRVTGDVDVARAAEEAEAGRS